MTAALGIDVSLWQNAVSTPQVMNFAKAKAGGVDFVFIKASQANFIDRDMLMNWANAKTAGLLRGAYHYLVWDKSAASQAQTLLSVTQADPPELGLVVDYEKASGAPGAGTARLLLKNTLEYLKAHTACKIIIYTSPGFWAEFGSADAYWAQYPLWLAHYTTGVPKVPKPWSNYTFWQYSDAGPGLALGAESKELDMDLFNGDQAQLYQWAGLAQNRQPATIDERLASLEAWAATLGYMPLK